MAPPKVIITGTGIAGTAWLARLLAALGRLDGAEADAWRFEYFALGAGGFAKHLLRPAEAERALVSAATLELDEDRHFELSVYFHELLHTLVRCEIPFSLLEFPRCVDDPRYAFQRLAPVLEETTWETFAPIHARLVAGPDCPRCVGEYVALAWGTPALAYAASRRRRRRQRWQRLALGLLAAAVLGLGIYRLSREMAPAGPALRSGLVQDSDESATDPESLPTTPPAPERATSP